MIRLVLAAACVVLLWAGASAEPARSAERAAEDTMLALLNDTRARHRLPPLRSHDALVQAARRHSREMARAGRLVHRRDFSDVGVRWRAVAENLAAGENPRRLHAYLYASPAHRRNMLGPYEIVGVGAVRTRAGRYYVTFIFAALA